MYITIDMNKLKITGKQLRTIGYPEAPVISIAIQVMGKYYKHHSTEEALQILRNLLNNPAGYLKDEVLGKIAAELVPVKEDESQKQIELNEEAIAVNVFGRDFIEDSALEQMRVASKLPVAKAAALMPDAHHGYGLPIGGVLATENAVIPYGVGVDIGCRMCLSIFDLNPLELSKRESCFSREINEATLFGAGAVFSKPSDDEVLERKEFDEISFLKPLQQRAWQQLGSSGSGNHFVEFGIVEVDEENALPGLPPGRYTGLLSHSGSRALGANIANHYTAIAKERCRLPKEAANLAWLSLDSEEGLEYWLAMNLAGDYASACHHVIHKKIYRSLGIEPLLVVENHHNFAWRENHEGRELIVHRKGATPAGNNVLGIIPGSMTAPGFIVKGKGNAASLDSASHGAGRRLSRTAALNNITLKELKTHLEKHDVKLMGGGLDEAPFAYKDIEMVMQSQKALVDIAGKFYPKIVKMDSGEPKNWKKKKAQVIGE